MPNEPTWPVFLLDGGDVAVYADASALRRDVEPWMAEQPVEWLDAVGRPLRLMTHGWRRTAGIELTGGPADAGRLRAALCAYLRAVGKSPPDAPDLGSFVRAAAEAID